MSGRAKRVLVYTASLLIAPLPVMAYERGTRGYAFAVMAAGAVLALSSLYAARGEMHTSPRALVGTKLLIASLGTLLLAALMLVGSTVYLLLYGTP